MHPIDGIRRILTIDDNDAIHSDFRKILATREPASKLKQAKAMLFGDAPAASESPKITFEIDSALQGEEGLQKLQLAVDSGRPYSVAFVDMRMPPGWDGVQTIQQLWEVDPDLQVVICTAFSDYSWDAISEKLGVTDRLLILKKPFDPAEISQLAIALSEKWALRRAAKLKMDQLEAMVTERTLELTKLAMHDTLTGLANRTLFAERLNRAIHKANATRDNATGDNGSGTYAYAVLFLDFDRFKVINDSLGHSAGDQLLRAIADRLTAALTLAGPSIGDAMAARLGGDEFTILIDGGPDLDAGAFAENLLKLLAGVYFIDHRDVHYTASIGLTGSRLPYTSAEQALRDADAAMYQAKAAGKARCVVFDCTMHEAAMTRLELENDLRQAIERNQLFLQYQPIVSLLTGRIDGFEALARWKHPLRGLISPMEFIPVAEEIGLIEPIGKWILEQACLQLKIWAEMFPGQNLTVSVNVSALQLRTIDFADQVAQIIQRSGIAASSLVLELTESAMIDDAETSLETMNRIRALGVPLHLDDFGTGYSSLSTLHQFSLSGLKIDRSFITRLDKRHHYPAVVNAIISLAKHLNIKLIAEGIENVKQIQLLQNMGCDLAQGFYFSKPVDVPAAEQLIRDRLTSTLAA